MKTQNRGFSLPEMMISMALMTIIILAISPMLNISFRGITTYEVHNSLKIANQTAINRLGHDLTECQRLFERPEGDFLARVTGVSLGQPPALANSLLPVKQPNGVLSPEHLSYLPGNAGNSLFFASLLSPEEVIVNPGPPPEVVRIDIYRFNYYYLGLGTQKPVAGKMNRNLWEWHSVGYVDYGRLTSMTVARKSAAVHELYGRGYRFAFDSSQALAFNAFHGLNADDTTSLLTPSHQIQRASGGELVKISPTGIMGGYHWGVSPNTDADFITLHPVPSFSTVNADFPSGFEVVTIGPNSRRKLFTRLVLAAEGSFKGFKSNEQVLLTSVRDTW